MKDTQIFEVGQEMREFLLIALQEFIGFSDADKCGEVLSEAEFKKSPLEQDVSLASSFFFKL